jgi:hypothetical protein
MGQTAATQLIQSLKDFQSHFGAERSGQDDFFSEWQSELPELTAADRRSLDQIRQRFRYQREMGKVAEGMVNAIVVSKLFELAGFYDAPFRVKSEASIIVAAIVEDDADDAAPKRLRGRIDFLVLQNQFWQAVIESKETTFDIENGIPQILSYMVGAPSEQNTVFGMVTNGTNFIFIKLQRGNDKSIVYDFSDVFSMLPRDNCLYAVLQILEKIAAIIIA